MKTALDARLRIVLSNKRPVTAWLVEHASYVLTELIRDTDGQGIPGWDSYTATKHASGFAKLVNISHGMSIKGTGISSTPSGNMGPFGPQLEQRPELSGSEGWKGGESSCCRSCYS